MTRPYTTLSCAISLDGYLDDASTRRLILSNAADLDRVDQVRADSDAILVGACTLRLDDPRLLVRSEQRVQERLAAGRSASPVKVTVSERADLDPDANFFTLGEVDKLVYCARDGVEHARERIGAVATIVDGGRPVRMARVCADLAERGVQRLLVEGGGTVLTQFLAEGLADEMHLVLAPFLIGDSRARRFVDDGAFPWRADSPARLVETRAIGDVVLLRYALSERCTG
ncbi:RibD family protein [Janibacter alittae]|uniref:Dihydrofolate reductase family protein n=1 Tax=Janibacter alittae TaxID=3115209 RepID=A0ABZ2ML79_9MICO